MTKRSLVNTFERIPLEYFYGLNQIELRPRNNPAIGKPFGCYLRDERVVVLHSLPEIWHLSKLGPGARRSVEKYHAEVRETESGLTVEWPVPGALTV